MFGSWDNASEVDKIIVRYTGNFNWSTIFFLAVVVLIYGALLRKKEYKLAVAGLSLYSVHWLCEICNALIAKIWGYPLWACTNDSTSYLLLIGVSIELSMMFALAGICAYQILPKDKNVKFLGLSIKWWDVIGMSVLFSCIEIFLASTGKFLWVYPWWGALLVCVTVYVPFFIAAVFVPDANSKFQKIFLISIVSLNVVLLAVLVPLGII
ncbi:MAG: hypothetical protein LKG11_06250 [Bacilli bacterium]|jgi:hypothetical protein|nr:hypothetical protein [Bacilli bacterium]